MIKHILKLSLIILSVFILTGCDESAVPTNSSSSPSSSTSTSTDSNDSNETNTTYYSIKVLDGYIQNATVTDSNGTTQTATYRGDGNYTFNSQPIYPIFTTGGTLIDTNMSFDINMSSDSNSSVITPLTTFLRDDTITTDILTKLKTALGTSDSENSDFQIDYIKSNDGNFTKFVQLLYISLKDTNLTKTYIESIKNSAVPTLNDLFVLFEEDVNSSSLSNKFQIRITLDKLLEYDGNASYIETQIKNYKTAISNFGNDGNITILKTAQTIFMDTNGTDANLSLTYGVDRNYTINGSDINNTRFITDNATRLQWSDNNDSNITKYTWNNADANCSALTLNSKSDWRLPTLYELTSIIDLNKSSPAIDTNFTHTANGGYWTSSTLNATTSKIYVDFTDGQYDSNTSSTDTYYLRCVRADINSSSGTHIRDEQKNVVMDTATKLMWQDDANTTNTWNNALSYCNSLSLSNYTDWRLPNFNELFSILDHNSSATAKISSTFNYKANDYYWSSSTYIDTNTSAWVIDFNGITNERSGKTNTHYIRCVRTIESQ